MTFKKVGVVLFLMFSLIPFRNAFAQVPNVGFIPANIWYSKDPFVEGDKIKIYTLVYNPDVRELSCTVIFFDSTTLLGTKDIKIAAKSVKDVSIDWTVTAGDHTIFAKIENAKFLISTGKYEEVYLAENKTEESKRSISKKIVAGLPDNIINSITDSAVVSNVKELVKNNTPAFVTSAIDLTVSSLENIRTSADTSLTDTKEVVQKQIDTLNATKINTEKDISLDGTTKVETVKEKLKSTETTNLVLKPFKYVELFFLTIFSFIFKNALIFYSLLAIVLFLIIRFIWRLIF